MNLVEHLITLLLCTFAAWATIGAIRRDHDDPPTVRIKLAALIAGPPLLLLLAGVPFTTVTGYYLAGFVLIYGLIYGLAFAFTAASYGLGNTLRAIDPGPPPEPDDPATGPPDDDLPEPYIFKDQK